MTSRSKLFGNGDPDELGDPDFTNPNPDLQKPKPLASSELRALEFMRNGFDLLVIGTTPPVLIRNYSNGRELELIKAYAGTVKSLRDRGLIEITAGSVYEKVGWLCYGLTPTGRRALE